MVKLCSECKGRGFVGSLLQFWKLRRCQGCDGNGSEWAEHLLHPERRSTKPKLPEPVRNEHE